MERIKKDDLVLIKAFKNSNQTGSVLLFLIVVMVIIGILGTAVLYVTTTTTYSELFFNTKDRAYYIAESGGNYAIPTILTSGTDTAAMLNLFNNKTFAMKNSSGVIASDSDKFTLSLTYGTTTAIATLASTGIVNAGSWFEGRRKITYKLQIPFFNPDMTGFTNVSGGQSWGDFETTTVDGNQAIKVTNTASSGRFAVQANLSDTLNSWMGTGTSIMRSYDVQTKILTDAIAVYQAGISFRLQTPSGANASNFGASFLRPDTTAGSIANNGIPDGLETSLGASNAYYIILWFDDGTGQQNSNHLLAYKKFTDTSSGLSNNTAPIYSYSFTSTPFPSEWTSNASPSGQGTGWEWKGSSYVNCVGAKKNGGTASLTTTNDMDLAAGATISFNHKGFTGSSDILGKVLLSSDAAHNNWTTLATYNSANGTSTWTQVLIDFGTSTTSNTTKIQFQVTNNNATDSNAANDVWQIDDVYIKANSKITPWSTLLVRINEGTLTASSEPAPAAIPAGTRVNDIKIYYGTPAGTGTPNTIATDNNRGGNPRDNAMWPPTQESRTNSQNDNFTLVTWDAVYPGNVLSGKSLELLGAGTVVRTNLFTTETLTAFSNTDWPELGLHAYGRGIANHVYFDDFSIRSIVQSGSLQF